MIQRNPTGLGKPQRRRVPTVRNRDHHVRIYRTLLGQPPALQTLSGAYLMALVPGNLAFLWFGVWRQSLQAMAIVRPALIAAAVANVFNAVANWALVFGNLGLPALGVRGSAIATSASRWLLFAVLLVLSWPLLGEHLRQLFSRAALRWRSFLQLLRLGVPISIQVSVEFYMFMIVALMMGNLGSEALAAHQIAVNVASLAFMVPMGIGAAAATRVGNAIGRSDRPGAERAASVSLALGGGVMVVFAACFALFPQPLARLYTDELGVVALAATFLPIAALFQVFDGTQVVAAGILRGTADTRIPATIAFFGFWLIGLPLAWWLTFRADFGPRGLWLGLTAGLATVAVLLVLRIVQRFRQPIAALVEE